MKKILLLAFFAAAVTACSDQKPEGTFFGESFNTDESIDAAKLITEMGNGPEYETAVRGKITEVCQQKGCWLKIDLGNGEAMRVSFKDYAYFVPKDISGKEVIIKGKAYFETISVEDQKHYLEDAGRPESEIAAVSEPKNELAFEATGVLLLK